MLSIELPTRTRDYVIAIRRINREDALTLSYLATRLGEDMLGARAQRKSDGDGFTVCWGKSRPLNFSSPPDLVVTDSARGAAERGTVLALGAAARNIALPAPAAARIYTLGGQPYDTAEYIAALCHCPAAYVALGALCRAIGFVPIQLAQRLLGITIGNTQPHMLSNCAEGALSGYSQASLTRAATGA